MQGKVSGTTFEVSPALPRQLVNLEVDKARLLDYRRWLLIGLVIIAAALFDGAQRSAPFSRGYQLEQVQQQRTQEEAIARGLLLDIAMLRALPRIEWLATNHLHMAAPKRGDAIVIGRVVPPEQPPSSVVAAR